MSKLTSSPGARASSSPVELRPAATVVVMRQGASAPEIFMVRRHQETAFMAGADVFPGGRVDASDRDLVDPGWCAGLESAQAQLDLAPDDAVAYRTAAIRELFEEAGVLLARDAAGAFVSLAGAEAHARFARYRADVHGGARTLRDIAERERLRVALDALVPFAHWVTPPVDTRRFDTRFFLARVPPEQTPAHDDTETTHGHWLSAAAALASAVRGDILLPPPTWTTLREIEPFSTVDDVLAWARRRRIVRRQPFHVVDGERRMLTLPGDPLNPEPPAEDVPAETRFVFVDGRWLPEVK